MYKEVFPQKLKKARENTGLTQTEVARDLKISRPTISQYETGTREPDIETLGKLADYYGVSIDWLVGSAGGKKTNFELDGIPRAKNAVSFEMRANIQDNM